LGLFIDLAVLDKSEKLRSQKQRIIFKFDNGVKLPAVASEQGKEGFIHWLVREATMFMKLTKGVYMQFIAIAPMLPIKT